VHPKGLAIDKEGNGWVVASAIDAVSEINTNGNRLGTFSGGGIVGPWGVAVDSQDNIWVANFGGPEQLTRKYGISELCGHSRHNCAVTGDAVTTDTGYTLPSGGDQVLLQNGKPLYGGDTTIETFKPLMRMTAVAIDMAGNLWAINNWKPESIEDTLLANPGGDGIVIFIGLAAPVMPTLYSGPPTAP
jgi:DNA-binding beta-propeller fold protein YncE